MQVFLCFCFYIFDCFSDVNRFNYALFFSVQFQSQETVCPLRSSCWQQDLRGETRSVIYLIWSDFAACAARIELHTMTLNSPQWREMAVSVQISFTVTCVGPVTATHNFVFTSEDFYDTSNLTNNFACSEHLVLCSTAYSLNMVFILDWGLGLPDLCVTIVVWIL